MVVKLSEGTVLIIVLVTRAPITHPTHILNPHYLSPHNDLCSICTCFAGKHNKM